MLSKTRGQTYPLTIHTESNLRNLNERGQSLVQVLVSIAIAGIVMASFSSMMVNQQREARALTEKLAASDLEKTAIAALADGTICNYVLNSPTPLTFNAAAVAAGNPQIIQVNRPLYASLIPGTPPTPGPVIAQVGRLASGFSSTLEVNSVELRVTSGTGNSYVANWEIGFDNMKTIRAVKPASVSTTITVSTTAPDSPTAARITGCQASTMNFANCVKREATTATKGACGFYSEVMCQPGETAVSGGIYGASNVAAQNSTALTNAANLPIGWAITAYDVAGTHCSGNSLTADGTVRNGSPPTFPIAGGSSNMAGAAFAICCK